MIGFEPERPTEGATWTPERTALTGRVLTHISTYIKDLQSDLLTVAFTANQLLTLLTAFSFSSVNIFIYAVWFDFCILIVPLCICICAYACLMLYSQLTSVFTVSMSMFRSDCKTDWISHSRGMRPQCA